MIEHQNIIHRLRLGQSVKAIHRETGRHKTVVRTLKKARASVNGIVWSPGGQRS